MALSTRMLHADDHLKGERDVAPPISVTVRHPNPRHARPPGRCHASRQGRVQYPAKPGCGPLSPPVGFKAACGQFPPPTLSAPPLSLSRIFPPSDRGGVCWR